MAAFCRHHTQQSEGQGVYHYAEIRDVRRTEGLDGVSDRLGNTHDACAELRSAIEEALDRLPIQQRKAIKLRMEGYEVIEIADSTGRCKRTVERLLQHGLIRLGKLLDD